jgi:formylmethanofuran dehydrogenase subunit B
MSAVDRVVSHATCLGCGCTCDDIELVVRDNRIAAARSACALGVEWFGEGRAPSRVMVRAREAARDEGLAAAASLLASASSPLVYLAPDISCEAQRQGVAIADVLHATLDSVTSDTILDSVLAAQERGRASATLGEVRNRADLLVCWGVDPNQRYPRFWSRYAPEPPGVHVPEGRRSRIVVAVDVGGARGPADADRRMSIAEQDEISSLTRLTALFLEGVSDPASPLAETAPTSNAPLTVPGLAAVATAARYAVVVCDAESSSGGTRIDSYRAPALIAMTQALNARTRAALCLLRAGGNRAGADAVMTSQTGFPAAVDFERGFPRYSPNDGTAAMRLRRGEVDAVLIVGAADRLPQGIASLMATADVVAIGPRASESAGAPAVAIDTAVAGIHEGGTVLRMDDVPLPVRAAIDGPPATAAIVRSLCERIVTVLARSSVA